MKKILILSIILAFVFKSEAQTEINNYKYVVIPLQYEFLKGKDTYRLNTLTRVLFKREGFDAYFNEEQLPQDLFKDRCLALYVDVKKVKGGFRKTKLEIILKDCNGKEVLKSDEGQSGENVHEKRHREALEDAFKSIERLNYSYSPNQNQVNNSKEDAAEKEVVERKEIKKIEKVKEVEELNNKPIEEEVPVEVVEAKEEIVEGFDAMTPKVEVLEVKPISQGFEVVNSESKVIMTLYRTAAEDIYIVKGKDAIVFKNGIKWMYSQNDGTSPVLKELNIKF